jgi:hypothetical protein
MRIRRALPFALALALTPLFGCATLIHGSKQTIHVETDPSGATVTVLGERHTSPVDLVLPRRTEDAEVVIEKEGYVSKKIALTRGTSKNTWLNFLGLPAGAVAGAAIGGNGKSGFEELGSGMAGLVVGAFALPGAFFAVDAATGAIHRLDPPSIAVRLEPAPASPSVAASTR